MDALEALQRADRRADRARMRDIELDDLVAVARPLLVTSTEISTVPSAFTVDALSCAGA